jgi:hypothetical protein
MRALLLPAMVSVVTVLLLGIVSETPSLERETAEIVTAVIDSMVDDWVTVTVEVKVVHPVREPPAAATAPAQLGTGAEHWPLLHVALVAVQRQ